MFSKFGKIAKVTVLRDKTTRRSRGVAFVQFARQEECDAAIQGMNGYVLEGFQLKCSLSKDNGRSSEFSSKRNSKKNAASTLCFECGQDGHMSYECPKNVLGKREREHNHHKHPRRLKTNEHKNKRKRKVYKFVVDDEDDLALSAFSFPSHTSSSNSSNIAKRHKAQKPKSYFSDED